MEEFDTYECWDPTAYYTGVVGSENPLSEEDAEFIKEFSRQCDEENE